MRLLSLYSPKMPISLVYMLQQVEYELGSFLKWFFELPDLSKVTYRQKLNFTRKAKALVQFTYAVWFLVVVVSLILILSNSYTLGVIFLILSPFICTATLYLTIFVARIFITGPNEKRLIVASEKLFATHPGIKIAVAGSYGKTTMKELLVTVLSEGKKVVATPGNMNVPISHAKWAHRLTKDEEILVIEYGEGAPGDVPRFAHTTHPTMGVITGLAPAHLDKYPSLQAAGEDIFALATYLKDKDIYVNGESEATKPFIKPDHFVYDVNGLEGWKVSGIEVSYERTRFIIRKGSDKIEIRSGLLGRHQVGPLVAAAVIGLKVGLTIDQIEAGMEKTVSFEHRLQPRQLHGAWIIDDTYNGNIDGIKAGLALLKELPASKKIYVTPGLVAQGTETEAVHIKMGELIADANPDEVVLMKNSVNNFIMTGLNSAGYPGKIVVEDAPLAFYTGLEHYLAAGDLILMQNDWTDNYR